MTTNEKIAQLRERMNKDHLDAYYVNTADPHQSEYISDYYKERAWLTGFSGSAGYALVTMKEALLWADGRYFIQAEKQIAGSEFRLMKMDTPGYPDLIGWLRENLAPGSKLGMCDYMVSQAFYEKLSAALSPCKIHLVADGSLIGDFWQDRPALPKGKLFLHELQFTGKTAAQKIAELRGKMKADRVEAQLLAGLDDIAWLYNFRGNDVEDNPVALAFALITMKEAKLFIDPDKVGPEVKKNLEENGIEVLDYEQVNSAVHELREESIALNKQRINRRLFRTLPEKIRVVDQRDYPALMKACLSEVELKNQMKAYVRDSAVITRFLFWVKREVSKGSRITEWDTVEKLHALRLPLENFIQESFSTIAAYGPNAAMMHYAPSPENSAELKARGFFLCDCGSQFYDGTTDVTRTIALGPLTDEEIHDFTLTLKSHISLARVIFLEGMTGHYIDIIAREPLWREYMDYKCGTGHGVGYVLGVHEGPQRISKAGVGAAVLHEGMVVTNEPGVYKEGKHGIRLENDCVVSFAGERDGDRFLRLETCTLVPLDRSAIDVALLSDEELEWLNSYHARVEKELLPLMSSEEERSELKAACAPLKRCES